MRVAFWAAAAVVIYTYFVYPALVCILSRLRRPLTSGASRLPSVSCVLSVFNEAAHLPAKLENLLKLDYPASLLQVLIGSDGSKDGTNEVLRGAPAGLPLTTIVRPDRQGKPAMLNALVPLASGDILVFMDARQRLAPDALKALVGPFQNPAVGCVSGELVFEDVSGKPAGVGLYWEYEKRIRKCESRLGSMMGATGALYAIRRQLFEPLPPEVLLDDVLVPLKVLQKGYRVILEPRARVFDRVARDGSEEFVRKVRTLSGNFQLLRYFPRLVNPLSGPAAWQFVSHKLLRLVVPYCLMVIFAASLWLWRTPFYAWALAVQVAFYVLAAAGAVSRFPLRAFDVPYAFCVMNWAAVVGLYRFLAGSQAITWEKAHGAG